MSRMKMSRFTLVAALSLCLLLLGILYPAEAIARPITDNAGAVPNFVSLQCIGRPCRNDQESSNICISSGYSGGVCRSAVAASHGEEQVDVNRGKVQSYMQSCCW
ncbi:hypothetical protein C5167_027259 [Papaver somniferum]|uniref:uncharacterized protein LOC113339817 n=1 Tax=Papaver somniferum TaxID=3469 RepID=UPI000E7005A9|nr:uncharacterized protein LOC113339817 [Papaver somniferum]RZC91196.1 hypothetical protein C5167_027259 [Papaver somniferum]